MLPHSYRDLPKIRDSISYLYYEYGRIEQTKLGVEHVDKHGRTLIPVANLSVLMLGPGTTVTHGAVKTLTRTGCLIIWTGEEGVRMYAQGLGETHKAYKLQRQAELVSHPDLHIQVVERMYRARFKETLPTHLTLQQIRGKEGARVRDAYAQAAAQHGIEWKGRNYNRGNWQDADPVNRALSTANACLNGISHAAVLTAGYCPGLGFIHQGKQLSFVYDVADLYKMRLSVPVAFSTVAEKTDKLETTVRKRMRQAFRNMRLLERIVPDLERLLNLNRVFLPDGFDPDDDPALPTPWWSPPGQGDDTVLPTQPDS